MGKGSGEVPACLQARLPLWGINHPVACGCRVSSRLHEMYVGKGKLTVERVAARYRWHLTPTDTPSGGWWCSIWLPLGQDKHWGLVELLRLM